MGTSFQEYSRKSVDETTEEYIDRMCQRKDMLGVTWEELSEAINEQVDTPHDESWYRKRWKKRQAALSFSEATNEVDEKLYALRLIKAQITDERTQANALFRRLSREETLKEIAHDFADQMESKKMLPISENITVNNDDRKAILVLSDWHYGLEVDNWLNKYNPSIAKKRLVVLKDSVIEECKRYNVKELYVVNLQDLINGRIHLKLRLNTRIDIVTQTMEVAEIMAELLTDLSEHFHIQYYDSLDNHSRIEPNKKDSLELETMARIIGWYLKERLANHTNIVINKNELAPDIVTFTVNGKNVVGVHGDKDKPRNVIKNLSMLTHKQYALVLTGHFHHFSGDEENRVRLVSNGSLIGTDDYSKDLRKDSEPSQNLIVLSNSTERGFIKCICPIVVE